jgi:hypothetical protein
MRWLYIPWQMYGFAREHSAARLLCRQAPLLQKRPTCRMRKALGFLFPEEGPFFPTDRERHAHIFFFMAPVFRTPQTAQVLFLRLSASDA